MPVVPTKAGPGVGSVVHSALAGQGRHGGTPLSHVRTKGHYPGAGTSDAAGCQRRCTFIVNTDRDDASKVPDHQPMANPGDTTEPSCQSRSLQCACGVRTHTNKGHKTSTHTAKTTDTTANAPQMQSSCHRADSTPAHTPTQERIAAVCTV